MKESKLFEAIQTLEKREFASFLKFVRSPFFQEHRYVLTLAGVFEDFYPDLNDDVLPREKIFDLVFEGEFNDLKVRHLMSDMLKLFERFVAYEIFEEDEVYLEINKLNYYRNKGLDKHFTTTEKRIHKSIEKNGVYTNEELYYKKFLLERELNQFMSDRFTRKGASNVKNTSEALDNFFILQKLRYGCMQLNYGKVFSQSFQLLLLDEIVQHVSRIDLSEDPLIRAYYYAYNMLKSPDETSSFFGLKEILSASTVFDISLNFELYNFAQNYCIGYINRGRKEFFEELFQLYKLSIKNDVVTYNQNLHPADFKNIVTIACRLEQYDWADDFIKNYGDYLPEEERENAITINRAQMYWYVGQLSQAVRLLSRVEFNDPFYALDAKSLLVRIYFELGEKDVLFSFCDSFKIYLKRNKLISKAHLNNHLRLISLVSKLAKLKSGQLEKLEKIKQDIIESQGLSNKKWLLEQAQKLESDLEEIH
ncbi:MAG: hypothetical protein JXQ87_12630 [Bacteroidia bacterium]